MGDPTWEMARTGEVIGRGAVVTPSGWGTKGATGSKGILNPGISLWF